MVGNLIPTQSRQETTYVVKRTTNMSPPQLIVNNEGKCVIMADKVLAESDVADTFDAI